MSGSTRAARRVTVLAVAPPDLTERLGRLLPNATMAIATVPSMVTRARQVRPGVVLCFTDDAEPGLQQLRDLRVAFPETRVLFVTPPGSIETRLAALEAGIDDVLAMPIDDIEVAGRLRLLARRSRPPRETRLPVGKGVELDLDRRELLRNGEWVHLRPKEARLLELFARAPGRVLTREQILRRVWGPNHHGDQRTVDVHVRWLRAKIEPLPRQPAFLLTVRGVGYRLETFPLTDR